MRILLLGASGFVGRALIRDLSRIAGMEITAGVRRLPPRRTDNVNYVCVDATDVDALTVAVDGHSHVVSCVMGSGDTMIRSTRSICEASLRTGVTRNIHFGSCAVYGATTGRITEETPTAGTGDWYASAKIACEALIGGAADRGLSGVVLRPSCIYGPGSEQWSWRLGRLLLTHRLGDLGTAGDGQCNVVYIDDVCAAVRAALAIPGDGLDSFILSGPPAGRWNDFLIQFAKALGAVPVSRLPEWRLALEAKLAGPALKVANLGLGRIGVAARTLPEAVTPSLLGTFRLDALYDGSRAARTLGITWTPIERGCAAAAAWVLGGGAE